MKLAVGNWGRNVSPHAMPDAMRWIAAGADLEVDKSDLRSDPRCYRQNFVVSHSYRVYSTRGVFLPQNGVLSGVLAGAGKDRVRVFVVIDRGLLDHHPSLGLVIEEKAEQDKTWTVVTEPLVISGGESSKNDPDVVERIHRNCARAGLDRHSYILALGGGAVLDAVGFAAATAHRGIRLVRVPTTVLSQNDSGVGVKNSVNRFGSKNFLGTFAPPWAVINDFDFLATLSQRDFVSGIAEAIKVGLIKDGAFFEWLEQHAARIVARDPGTVETLIERTATLHLEHIAGAGDPFELGSSRPLDFGHWVAHKLESLTNNEVTHGEAVAIGISLDVLYSAAVGALDAEDVERVLHLVEFVGLPMYHAALEREDGSGRPVYLEGLEEFRQHLGGCLSVTLLDRIGAAHQVGEIDEEMMEICRRRLATRSSK